MNARTAAVVLAAMVASVSPAEVADTRPTAPSTQPTTVAADLSVGPMPPDQTPRRPSGLRTIKQHDANAGGKLSDAERQAVHRGRLTGLGELRRRWNLRRYDADTDGTLSRQEQATMDKDNADRRARTAQLCREWLDKYDTDRDGKISPEEDRAALRSLRQAWHGSTLQQRQPTTRPTTAPQQQNAEGPWPRASSTFTSAPAPIE